MSSPPCKVQSTEYTRSSRCCYREGQLLRGEVGISLLHLANDELNGLVPLKLIVDAVAFNVEFPAVIDAAQAVLLVAPEEQRRALGQASANA